MAISIDKKNLIPRMGQLYVEGSKVVLMIYFPCNLVTHFQGLMALGYEIFGFNIGDYTTHLGMYQRMEEFCLLVVHMLRIILNLFIQWMELGIQSLSLFWNITASKKNKETLVNVIKILCFTQFFLPDRWRRKISSNRRWQWGIRYCNKI